MAYIQGDHIPSQIGTKADVAPRHVLHPNIGDTHSVMAPKHVLHPNIGDTHSLMAPKHEVHPGEVYDLSKGGMDLDPPHPTPRGKDNF
jgi:hypothetical protein